MTENDENNIEEAEESPEIDLERLNTLLATTENSLREMENERNRERILRERNEKEIVMLAGDVKRLAREKDVLWGKKNAAEQNAAKADVKRRHEVERVENLKAEMGTLRRANKALESQVKAFDACSNSKPAVEEKD